ncbi:UBC-like protein [Mycena venus]|uniref:UBC-like protein n=1 Tax=Mycena venus TaxID=2733690 RepID=A0A8H7CIA0_9AGAR|nr:UBC-like protein [Mycena venus]
MAGLNKNNSAVKRIMQEARELASDPSPEYSAAPLEDDIFEWHCTLRGPVGTEFEGGQGFMHDVINQSYKLLEGLYHFRILLPAEYPFRPPSIMMLTPSGRFETDTKICISFTSYHEELWQPAWGVRTAIIGLQGFFPLKGKAAVGIGSIEHPVAERKRLAQLSRSWVCPVCRETNHALLPDPVAPEFAGAGRTLGSSSTTERAAPPELPAPVPASASITDADLAAPPAPNSVASPQPAAPLRPQISQIKRQQRPPILLDTAICVILVVLCGIVFRRVF